MLDSSPAAAYMMIAILVFFILAGIVEWLWKKFKKPKYKGTLFIKDREPD